MGEEAHGTNPKSTTLLALDSMRFWGARTVVHIVQFYCSGSAASAGLSLTRPLFFEHFRQFRK